MTLLTAGTKAPDFILPSQDGVPTKLADFRGKYVIIYFYPKALTPGCTAQACALRDAKAELGQKGVSVVGISGDKPSLLYKFVEKEQLNFNLLGDPEHETLENYGVWQQKSMMGKSYMGVARVTYLVDDKGLILHVWPKVDPKTHLDDVLGWLDSHHKGIKASA